jgi:septal ring factor EnvC (AmiA/AmiB activator)
VLAKDEWCDQVSIFNRILPFITLLSYTHAVNYMTNATATEESVRFHIENIGGINEATIEFSPGVSILTGRNATNRTSLLQAIIAVIGSDAATVKGDADEGHVELTIGNRTYTRHLTRQGGTITTSGDPYLGDATLADLFAFLLESNEARQAVARSDDLRDIIMEPVDTADIKAEIDKLQKERDRLDTQLDEISSLKRDLPDIEQERVELDDDIADKREELNELEEKIEDIDEDVSEHKKEQQEFEEKLSVLKEVRNEFESVRQRLDSEQSSLEALRNEREEVEADMEEYEAIPDGRLDGIQSEIQRLRDEESQLGSKVDKLQTVIQFNEDLLDGSLDIFADLEGSETTDITEQLLEDSEEVICWTCGSEVDTDQIEQMLERLQELRNEQMSQRTALEEDIDDLNQERRQLEEKRRQRQEIERRLETIETEIDDREARTEDLKERKTDLIERVESLETEVDTLQTDTQSDSELIELHKEANRLEVEIERLEADRDDLEAEIDEIESRIQDRSELETRREEVQSKVEDLRTRVKRLEQQAVAQFNGHMESILDILEYDNLERIWIERSEQQVREGRKTITKGRFDLHVVRSTESGTVYEDTVDHLSESEREVTGLVFALAGYLVHDVYEEVPIMLMDSLEAIDAPRLAEIINYFKDHTDYLIVALLEEDAETLNDDYNHITNI